MKPSLGEHPFLERPHRTLFGLALPEEQSIPALLQRALDAAGAERCRRCDGNGAYNLRRSGIGYGYAWAQCCVCLGYGRVLTEGKQ